MAGSSTPLRTAIARSAPSGSSNSANPKPCGLFAGVMRRLNALIGPHACAASVSTRATVYGGRAHGEEGVEEAVGDAGGDGADEEVRRALRAGRDAERGRAEVLLLGESLD
jgi:hypothetical protein